jgi:hypothetical protein
MPKHATRRSPGPLPRNLWIPPGVALLAALVAAAVGYLGAATGFLIAGIGAALVVFGRHRRWKGAPEAGYLLAAVGLIIFIVALAQ